MSSYQGFWNYTEEELRPSGIYRIVHMPSGREYIGQAKSFKTRWPNHIDTLRAHVHRNKRLEHSWHAHGEQEFQFFILEYVELNKTLLDAREQFYFDTRHPYYNICLTAGSMLGYRHSVATRARLRENWVSRRQNPSPREVAYRLSMFGRKQRPETVERRQMVLRGKRRTADHRLNYSRARSAFYFTHTQELQKTILATIDDLQRQKHPLHSLYQASALIATILHMKVNNIYRILRLLEVTGDIQLPRNSTNRSEIMRNLYEQLSPEKKEARRLKLCHPQTPERRAINSQSHMGLRQSEATKQKRKETWRTHIPSEKELAARAASLERLRIHQEEGLRKGYVTIQAKYQERQQLILTHMTQLGWGTSAPCGAFPAAKILSEIMQISVGTIYDILRKMEARGEITTLPSRHTLAPQENHQPSSRPIQGTIFEEG